MLIAAGQKKSLNLVSSNINNPPIKRIFLPLPSDFFGNRFA